MSDNGERGRTPLWGAGSPSDPTQPLPQESQPTPIPSDPTAPVPGPQPPASGSGWDAWNWAGSPAQSPAPSTGPAAAPVSATPAVASGAFGVPADVPRPEAASATGSPAAGWGQPAAGDPLGGGRPGRGRGPGWPALIAVAAVAAVGGGAVGAGVSGYLPTQLPAIHSSGGPAAPAAGSVAAIAKAVLPSVVTIQAAGAGSSATGSGFVYDRAGHVVTNNHVVDGVGDNIVVILSNGERVAASVVGTDDAYDIAVLATGRTTLPPLTMGDSDAVAVGDPVLAIGAPLGLSSTVTSGIVSAVHRPVVAGDASSRSYINAIQTDAAINPGNSGGPLLDGSGRVIGVNSAIAAPPGSSAGSAGNIGLGFAIPSVQVVKTANQLIRSGHAEHPVMGVLLDESYDGPGARIRDAATGVEPIVTGGAAQKAGMKPGDVVLSLDGTQITSNNDLIVAVRAHDVGDKVAVKVRRDGRTIDVTMTLQAAPKN